MLATNDATLENLKLKRSRVQRVSDFVCEAGSEGANRREPLGPKRSPLSGSLFGDVDPDREDHGRPIPTFRDLGELPFHEANSTGSNRQAQIRAFGPDEMPSGLAEHLRRCETGGFREPAVPDQDPVVSVESEHESRNALDDTSMVLIRTFKLSMERVSFA
jgi:hypothetical protein